MWFDAPNLWLGLGLIFDAPLSARGEASLATELRETFFQCLFSAPDFHETKSYCTARLMGTWVWSADLVTGLPRSDMTLTPRWQLGIGECSSVSPSR